eukprot:CAMPEP_0204119782 /NCGR_PEP_ID=MMETSP0361-20130328/7305_1 /ASSEMBLY_ACC=CAM_ASM_000343 /TAXON_ID=268821 /ORGANISM="Scrippsiella Hangoei, Strain SHTV-5" /LENGTH=67 /DNA_ID=CAMNT_0051070957 /DNA_START=63 /DNA_END=266 /DNA_ORIENTATION=+
MMRVHWDQTDEACPDEVERIQDQPLVMTYSPNVCEVNVQIGEARAGRGDARQMPREPARGSGRHKAD